MTSKQVAAAPDATAWRTRDIVVTAVIAVAFGVVFQVWNTLWGGFDALFAFWPPAKNLLYGVWLVPAVLAPAIVRKPGAALFAELVAAGVSVLFGSPWGPDTLLSGFVQGAGAELVFAFTLYRRWSLPVLALASIASAAGAWVHDWVVWFPTVPLVFANEPIKNAAGATVNPPGDVLGTAWWMLTGPDALISEALLGIVMAISAVVIVGIGSLLLIRALRQTGVLDGFPAGS